MQASVGGQTVADADFTIDGAGRVRGIFSRTLPVGSSTLEAVNVSYEYDGLDRITFFGSAYVPFTYHRCVAKYCLAILATLKPDSTAL
jgi:hypothetical protein